MGKNKLAHAIIFNSSWKFNHFGTFVSWRIQISILSNSVISYLTLSVRVCLNTIHAYLHLLACIWHQRQKKAQFKLKLFTTTWKEYVIIYLFRSFFWHLLLDFVLLVDKFADITWFCSDTDDKYRYEIKDILEMEMKILEALDFYLVVFHPYHSLTE